MAIKDRKEREREERRRQILDAALQVFSRKGYEKTTMDEIAEKAELSKGVLYYYFHNKEDLFYELIIRESEKFYLKAFEKIKDMKDHREVFSTLFNFHISYFKDKKEILALIFPFGKSSPVFTNEKIRERISHIRKPIADKIIELRGDEGVVMFELFWSYIIGLSIKMEQGRDIKREAELFQKMLKGVLK